jgi:hypothetical protein
MTEFICRRSLSFSLSRSLGVVRGGVKRRREMHPAVYATAALGGLVEIDF